MGRGKDIRAIASAGLRLVSLACLVGCTVTPKASQSTSGTGGQGGQANDFRSRCDSYCAAAAAKGCAEAQVPAACSLLCQNDFGLANMPGGTCTQAQSSAVDCKWATWYPMACLGAEPPDTVCADERNAVVACQAPTGGGGASNGGAAGGPAGPGGVGAGGSSGSAGAAGSSGGGSGRNCSSCSLALANFEAACDPSPTATCVQQNTSSVGADGSTVSVSSFCYSDGTRIKVTSMPKPAGAGAPGTISIAQIIKNGVVCATANSTIRSQQVDGGTQTVEYSDVYEDGNGDVVATLSIMPMVTADGSEAGGPKMITCPGRPTELFVDCRTPTPKCTVGTCM